MRKRIFYKIQISKVIQEKICIQKFECKKKERMQCNILIPDCIVYRECFIITSIIYPIFTPFYRIIFIILSTEYFPSKLTYGRENISV